MKLILPLVLGLFLISCHPADKSANATAKNSSSQTEAASKATISASPNPVPAGGELGETTIAWDTGTGQIGEVYVSKNGGAEQRFGAKASGSEKAKWIRAHVRYEFRLYQGTAHDKVLAKVDVTHK